MTKTELIYEVANKTGLSKNDAENEMKVAEENIEVQMSFDDFPEVMT